MAETSMQQMAKETVRQIFGKTPKRNSLSREQAAKLYDDLKEAVTTMQRKRPGAAAPKRAATEPRRAAPQSAPQRETLSTLNPNRFSAPQRGGAQLALGLIALLIVAKGTVAVLEFSGVLSVSPVEAAMTKVEKRAAGAPFSREELQILTSLDSRRAELEERSRRLEEREMDLANREREHAVRLTQLKDLTDQLKSDRDKNEKKRNAQIDQLANVYGSMNPPEAAALIEQLDVTIALSLLERMPEKRIAQILALMGSERALMLTRMLSGKAA